jgi:alkyl hydroperoxide reductase subunit AhpF
LTGDPNLRDEVVALKSIKIFDHHAVSRIEGRDKIEHVWAKNILSLERIQFDAEAIFVAIGSSPNSSLIKNLADLNNKGEIEINPDCSTKTPGLFAAGDVTNVFARRIIIASGEGAKAALAAKQYLMRK